MSHTHLTHPAHANNWTQHDSLRRRSMYTHWRTVFIYLSNLNHSSFTSTILVEISSITSLPSAALDSCGTHGSTPLCVLVDGAPHRPVRPPAVVVLRVRRVLGPWQYLLGLPDVPLPSSRSGDCTLHDFPSFNAVSHRTKWFWEPVQIRGSAIAVALAHQRKSTHRECHVQFHYPRHALSVILLTKYV